MRFFRSIVEVGKLAAHVAAVPLAVVADVATMGVHATVDGKSLTRRQIENVEEQADNVDEAIKS